MNAQELKELKKAVNILENPGLAAKIGDIIGSPIEKSIALLPNKAINIISKTTHNAISGSLKIALKTLIHHNPKSNLSAPDASNWWHIAAAAATGAAGGAFGLSALVIELPISTTIMMRSIADVARSEGADLQDIETQLECIQVLAFGGKSSNDDATEVGYFVAREAMTKAATEALAHLTKNGLQKESAPALIRLITLIAERYSINVTEKAAAQMIPLLGAIGGALINTIFIDHFQDMARGHFINRRLEKKYGQKIVQAKYIEYRNEMKK